MHALWFPHMATSQQFVEETRFSPVMSSKHTQACFPYEVCDTLNHLLHRAHTYSELCELIYVSHPATWQGNCWSRCSERAVRPHCSPTINPLVFLTPPLSSCIQLTLASFPPYTVADLSPSHSQAGWHCARSVLVLRQISYLADVRHLISHIVGKLLYETNTRSSLTPAHTQMPGVSDLQSWVQSLWSCNIQNTELQPWQSGRAVGGESHIQTPLSQLLMYKALYLVKCPLPRHWNWLLWALTFTQSWPPTSLKETGECP